MPEFGPETTTDEVLEGIDLTGRTVLVTGASGGLGAESARALASKGATVVLACRDVAKGEQVAKAIRERYDAGDRIDVEELDLLSYDSIRAFAGRFLAKHPRLHILLNNAGVMACPLHRTAEGRELQFATNHLGHFLLTGLLAPALVAAAPARVVNVSSGGHRFSPVLLDDVDFERTPYDKWIAYGQAKSANVLHAVELDRRLSSRGVRAFAIHPGGIVTELGRHLTEDDIKELMARAEGSSLTWKSVEAGAATQVFAATSPTLADRGGIYLEDCAIAEPSSDANSSGGYMPWAVDADAARRLWTLSESLVGQPFPL